MARRVRHEPLELRLVAPDDDAEVHAADRLDPRASLLAPEQFAGDPERLLAWASLNAAPALVQTDTAAQAAARNRERLAALTPERSLELAAHARAARRSR